MNLPEHLARLTAFVSDAHRLPQVLDDLGRLPPGTADQAEAEELLAALAALGVRRDGRAVDPTREPAARIEAAVQAAAIPAAEALRRAAFALLNRLDLLAQRGVRPPEAVLPADFADIIYLTNIDHPTAAPTAAGVYDSLAPGHPLRGRL